MLKAITIVGILVTVGWATANAQVKLAEVADQWGVDHYHRGLIGGGVAIFDFNNDGFQDMYLTGGRFRDKLYKNNGNGTFLDIASFAGLDTTIFYNTMSVVTGDINNDGYRDIFVGTDQFRHHLLFLNNGDGTYKEISQSAGIDAFEWATGGVFADFNMDGWLDLYIANYVQRQEALVDEEGEVVGFNHSCFPNRLYLNNGDLTFTDATVETQTGDIGCGLAVVATDLNNDHRPDLFVANDFGEWVAPNAGLVNDFPETAFTNRSDALDVGKAIYGMGIAKGDYNRDGFMDYYVTNLGSNILHTGGPTYVYADLASQAGVENTFNTGVFTTGWGTAFVDLNHDGYEDLLVSNGDIPAARFIANDQEDPNKLFFNKGDGTFEDLSVDVGFNETTRGRGLAVGDLDNDGDQEVVVAIAAENDDSGRLLIYENQHLSDHNWLKVMLQGTQVNIDAFGTKVFLYDQGELWIKELNGGSSHASQHSSLLHYGLGSVEQLDSVVVIWPGGKQQSIADVNANSVIRITEDQDSYQIAGCTNTEASNFNANATFNYGCFVEVAGCMDPSLVSFDMNANLDNGECTPEEVVTAIDDLDDNWQIYPNPMTSATLIEAKCSSQIHMELMDLSGRILRSTTFQNAYQLNRGDLPSGVYILRLTTQGKSTTKKLIIR
ncbi:MAG: FG-GAP-like repeat-containing protein [Cyclobacteriaceae bacterium]